LIPYIISSFRGGLSDENTRGIAGSFKAGWDLDIHKRRDSLSCNFKMMTITDTRCSSLVKYAVNGADGSSWCFSDKGDIMSIAGSATDPVQNYHYTDANGEIKGAAEWQLDTGQDYLFWCTNTSVARKLFPGADYNVWTDEASFRDTLDPCAYHPMAEACGNMNIGNNNFVSHIDYSGNFVLAGMNLRPGNVIKCLEERDDYLIIGTERKGNDEEGHIWNWITTALNWVQKKKIPVSGVNALIDTEKLLLQGGTAGEIFHSDFINSVPLNSVPEGGQCNPGGVTVENDLALFGIYGTAPGLYSYGRRMMNRPSAFNLEHRLAATASGSTISEIGSVWTNNGVTYASWKTSESNGDHAYGVDMVSTTTRATAKYEGLEFLGGSPHLKKSFDSAKFVMEKLPSGCSVSYKYKVSRNTDWRYANVSGTTGTTYSTTDSTEAEFIVNDKTKTYEVGVELNPSGSSTPEITSIITYISDKPDEH
jgi:hypothetical protein